MHREIGHGKEPTMLNVPNVRESLSTSWKSVRVKSVWLSSIARAVELPAAGHVWGRGLLQLPSNPNKMCPDCKSIIGAKSKHFGQKGSNGWAQAPLESRDSQVSSSFLTGLVVGVRLSSNGVIYDVSIAGCASPCAVYRWIDDAKARFQSVIGNGQIRHPSCKCI